MKKNKILAFLLSLSIVPGILGNLNPQSSDVFATEVSEIGIAQNQNKYFFDKDKIIFGSGIISALIVGIAIGIPIGRSTKKIPNNDTKIKGDNNNKYNCF